MTDRHERGGRSMTFDAFEGKRRFRIRFGGCENMAVLGAYAGGLSRAGFEISECSDLNYDTEEGSVVVAVDDQIELLAKWRLVDADLRDLVLGAPTEVTA